MELSGTYQTIKGDKEMENRIKLDELIHDEILLEYEKIKETTKKDDFNFVRANYALRKGLTIKELSKSTQHEELKKEMHKDACKCFDEAALYLAAIKRNINSAELLSRSIKNAQIRGIFPSMAGMLFKFCVRKV